MLKVGITGGIGSGKTTICKVFEVLGIPVFYADTAARELMDTDDELKAGISAIFGPEIFVDGKLDRPSVSKIVFDNPSKLHALNGLVHPASVQAGSHWFAQQNAPYAIKEAAIFFESGTAKDIDFMIGVSAPVETRIARTIARSGLTRQDVLARMAQQMDETEKMSLCDFVIINDGMLAVLPQVLALHERLLAKGGL